MIQRLLTGLFLFSAACSAEVAPPERLAHSESAVRQGQPDTGNVYANVVKLNLTDAAGSYSCTGTVITPTRVLTAAHCLIGAISATVVWYGANDVPLGSRAGALFRVHPLFGTPLGQLPIARTVTHPSIPGGTAGVLEGPDLGTVDVVGAPLPLTPRPLGTNPVSSGTFTTVGYGLLSSTQASPGRRVGTVTVTTVLPMIRTQTARLRGATLVVAPAPNLGCSGDSGAPLIDGSGRIVAVMTGAYGPIAGCDNELNNTYPATYDFQTWIYMISPPPFAFHNYGLPVDVNGNGFVASDDAQLVINALNAGTGLSSQPFAYRDTNPDGALTALDALRVINALNRFETSGYVIH